MNTIQHLNAWLTGKKTYLIAAASVLYAWGINKGLWAHSGVIDTALGAGGVASLRHGMTTTISKVLAAALTDPTLLPSLRTAAAPPRPSPAPAPAPAPAAPAPTPPAATSGSVNMATLFAILGASALCCIPLVLFVPGCAGLAPGADPFVVRIEQAQATAKPTFDLVLDTEGSNRAFWETNLPDLHNFCEWLRQPQPVTGPTAFGTNISISLPRASAMQWNLDQIKTAYKAGLATSNDVNTVLTTLTSAIGQASTWSALLTNSLSH